LIQQLALIGCGLMGGSFSLGLQRAGLVKHVVGYSPSLATRQKALVLGVIHTACASVEEACLQSDLILLATPVSAIENALKIISNVMADDAWVMDVGSTKSDIVASARRVMGKRLSQFMPAHPIAGKEKAGVTHADADLYQNRTLILTPLTETPSDLIGQATVLWKTLGSSVHQLTPDAHDQIFATVSHLPHLIAFAAMHAINQQDHAQQLLQMAGPGFKDFSRLAASDPHVWRDIFLANSTHIKQQAQLFQNAMQTWIQMMDQGDGAQLFEAIQKVSQTRSQWQIGAANQDDSN